MYSFIRIIIGVAFGVVAIIAILRSRLSHKVAKCVICAIATYIAIIGLEFVPFENLFLTFDSPEAAYRYFATESVNSVSVVAGKNSDLVIGDDNGTDRCLIIPKTAEGWKVGLAMNSRKVGLAQIPGANIYLYQYKKTSDYFVAIYYTGSELPEIADSYHSDFLCIEDNNSFVLATGLVSVSYYANIPDIDKYWIEVNGERISAFDQLWFWPW